MAPRLPVHPHPQNSARAILGAYGFNESKQDLFKFKGAYDFSDEIMDSSPWDFGTQVSRVDNYLRDGLGNTFWDGNITYNGMSKDLK